MVPWTGWEAGDNHLIVSVQTLVYAAERAPVPLSHILIQS